MLPWQRFARRIAPGLLPLLVVSTACRPAHAPEREARASVSQGVQGVAAVNGTTLWYEIAGQGPPVVLLHGGNLDHRMWDDQFAPLARAHRVVRYDARGFGRSGRADVPFAAHDDLLALLRYLGVAPRSWACRSAGASPWTSPSHTPTWSTGSCSPARD